MKIEHLKEYIVFGSRMNYSSAARELHISQPSLFEHIAAIEKETGLSLVDRNKSPLRLTEVGEVFLGRAQDVINAYEAALLDCRKAKREHTLVRVLDFRAAIPIVDICTSACAPLDECDHQMEYSVSYVYPKRLSVEEHIRNRLVDAAFVFAAPESLTTVNSLIAGGITAVKMYSVPCAVYVEDGSALANKGILSLDDLDGQTSMALNHPVFQSFHLAVTEMFRSMGVNISLKLLSAESAIDYPDIRDGNCIQIDVQHHRNVVADLSTPSRPTSLVMKHIAGTTLFLDVYLAYDRNVITVSAKRWLDRLLIVARQSELGRSLRRL